MKETVTLQPPELGPDGLPLPSSELLAKVEALVTVVNDGHGNLTPVVPIGQVWEDMHGRTFRWDDPGQAELRAELAAHQKEQATMQAHLEAVIATGVVVPPHVSEQLGAVDVTLVPAEVERLIHELRAWQGAGHGGSCCHRRCGDLRQQLADAGALDLVDRYPKRAPYVENLKTYLLDVYNPLHHGSIKNAICEHNINVLEVCGLCDDLFDQGGLR